LILSLDTNVAVDLMRGRRPDVRERFERGCVAAEKVVLSTVVLFELAHGVRRSARPDAQAKVLDDLLNDLNIVEFDAADALTAGDLRHQLEEPGLPIGPADFLIAGQAINRGWTVVTNDVGHFGRVRGLALIDWRVSDLRLTPQEIVARLARDPKDK
jgi:tRNA(fMet)-specific endonuclease VapC